MSIRHSLIVGATLSAFMPAIAGIAWSQSASQPVPQAISSKILAQSDGPWSDATTMIVQVDLAPGARIARHTQPGQERILVLAGHGELMVDGELSRRMWAGEAAFVPFGKAHSFINGDTQTRLESTLIVAKGKPLAAYLSTTSALAMSVAGNATTADNGTRVYE